MNLRKGHKRKCLIYILFGLAAVHYLLLSHLIFTKHRFSLTRRESDFTRASWNDRFETIHFHPKQRGVRDKRALFQIGSNRGMGTDDISNTMLSTKDQDNDFDASFKKATDVNSKPPSKDSKQYDFDTFIKNGNKPTTLNANAQYDFDTSMKISAKENNHKTPKNSLETVDDVVSDAKKEKMSSDPTLLVLFSSWGYSKEKRNVHQTLLRLWASWPKSLVNPLVFTKDSKVRGMAIDAKWHVLPVGEINDNCKGPPVLRGLFTDTLRIYDTSFYGYANSDIIFGNGLIRTLRFLQKIYRSSKRPVLIIGRRYNYDFISNHVHLKNPSEVGGLATNGILVNQSTDYYITNAEFPWNEVPMVSVGRLFVARAVVTYAIKHKYDVIDATKTIESVHLTTSDGNYASHSTPGRFCNYFALKESKLRPSYLRFGHCECAKLETSFNSDGEIELRSRDPSVEMCGASKK